ncbi:MAG: hypothetical protein WAW91_00020 [Candidatus Nanoperiomorbaceae bacterium]
MSIFVNKDNLNINNDRISLRNRKILIVSIILLSVVFIILLSVLAQPSPAQKRQQTLDRNATTASRKQKTSGTWTASGTVATGGFASAIIKQDSGAGQGYVAIYKVGHDGTMTQIASGSYLSPIDLVILGVPFNEQARLSSQTVDQVRQNFERQCSYNGGNTPGYDANSFFGVQIDGQPALGGGKTMAIQYGLSQSIIARNQAQSNASDKVVCVVADSDSNAGQNDYAVNLSFKLKFITDGGVVTTHAFQYSAPSQVGAVTMKLDGQRI